MGHRISGTLYKWDIVGLAQVGHRASTRFVHVFQVLSSDGRYEHQNRKPLNWAKTTLTDHYGNDKHSFIELNFVRCVGYRGEKQKVYNVKNEVKNYSPHDSSK